MVSARILRLASLIAPLLWPFLLPSQLIHEGGHALAGLIMTRGPVCADLGFAPSSEGKTWGRLTVRIRIFRLGGWVFLEPPSLRAYRVIVLAGPAASLAVGLIVFAALANAGWSFWASAGLAALIGADLAQMLPARSGGQMSDGALTWALRKGVSGRSPREFVAKPPWSSPPPCGQSGCCS